MNLVGMRNGLTNLQKIVFMMTLDKNSLHHSLMDLICIYDIKSIDSPYKIRIGHPYDGGYVLIDNLCRGIEVVYSFGIAGDTSFEQHFSHNLPQVQNLREVFC